MARGGQGQRRACGGLWARLGGAALLALASAVWAETAAGQTPAQAGDAWWRQWSPLAPVADLVRPAAPVP
ncbi:MAG: hypothetical protein ACQERF_10590, partial [Actinomycetota bacterium]